MFLFTQGQKFQNPNKSSLLTNNFIDITDKITKQKPSVIQFTS